VRISGIKNGFLAFLVITKSAGASQLKSEHSSVYLLGFRGLPLNEVKYRIVLMLTQGSDEAMNRFQQAASAVFVRAYEHQAQASLSPAFEGKPLGFLSLSVSTIYRPEEYQGPQRDSESLQISPLDINLQADLGNYQEGALTAAESRRYLRLAATVMQTAVSAELDVTEVVSAGSIFAAYRLRLNNNTSARINTLSPKPEPMILTSATAYTEGVLEQIGPQTKANQMRHNLLQTLPAERTEASLTAHGLSFLLHPDLPLNGHESITFLEHYFYAMEKRIKTYKAILEDAIRSWQDPADIDVLEFEVERATAAKSRAFAKLQEGS
jgi:hypothetical protein